MSNVYCGVHGLIIERARTDTRSRDSPAPRGPGARESHGTAPSKAIGYHTCLILQYSVPIRTGQGKAIIAAQALVATTSIEARHKPEFKLDVVMG